MSVGPTNKKLFLIGGGLAVVAAASAVAICLRFSQTSANGLIVMICPTRQVYVQRTDPEGFDAGLRSLDEAMDRLVDKHLAKGQASLAGNMFSGLFDSIFEGLRPVFKDIANRGFDDRCAYRNTDWLNELSERMKQ